MPTFVKIQLPSNGETIAVHDGELQVPARPIIPFIAGDGIGRDIMPPTRQVLDAAIEKAYQGRRAIEWLEVYAGAKAQELYGEVLPEDTFKAIRRFTVALKGPLKTPIGSGFRSLNVALRQTLDLYACIRPVRYLPGVPSPLKHPERVNFVIVRENTEDVYAGIEWERGTPEAQKLIALLNGEFGTQIRSDSGIGIKPISETGSKRLVRKAIQYALDHGRRRVTLMHKGNIMKYTEGAFRKWGYDLAAEEFSDRVISEDTLWDQYDGKLPDDKILLNDRIADITFQHVLLRPTEFEVIATPNLNGDYLSDACAAQVGGLGVAHGANIGDSMGLFEPTHGTAPSHAGKNEVNPTALILSGVMMLDYLGWGEAGKLVQQALAKTIGQKRVTYDLARQMEGATKLSTSEFGEAVSENL
ncbi:MAG TPA: isocitrate dehydrogenase (NADP(+)) [Candidatus Fraserbacteria bacterium]|nr:isocitrate dehydrogenase (NADP(+)) [Candidatus Fraserbacteria bacterium]